MDNLVLNYIKQNNLIEPNSKVVVALSGGVDSMVLLTIMERLGYDLVVAHVNHKVRLDSEIEEEYIKKICLEKNIPLEILHLEKINKNFEAKAHKKRYDFFLNVCKKHNASYLLTAHHADDNIETIIMNLMSGSNLYGYGGISRELIIDNIHIVRPLLPFTKSAIKEYALKNNVTYFEDYTNQSDDYTRNRIRHHIIPRLKEECPSILERSNSFSNQIHEAFDYIREQSIKYLNANNNMIDNSSFKDLHSFLQKDIVCLLLENTDVLRTENLINDIVSIILSDKPQLDYNLKNNLIFKKRYDKSYIENQKSLSDFKYIITEINQVIEDDNFKISFLKEKPNNTNYIKLCYNDIAFPLTIRNRCDGDEIVMSYGHKKIKDLLIDKKIPKENRDLIPIVLDAANDVLWVYDVAKSKKVISCKDNFDCFLAIEVK